jgi:RNA polymerase sigma-70 factor, ECF subfamily
MTASVENLGPLLSAARSGSVEALGQMLQAHRAYLLHIANEELAADLQAKGGASDLVQDTFLEAHRDFARFQGSTEEELLAWLRGLLRHRIANFVRRYRDTQKRGLDQEVALDGVLADDLPSPSGEAAALEQALLLQRAMEGLPDDYRQVIALRYQEQLGFEEIGQRLGRSAEAARKLWWRAIERLQQELSPS